MTGIEMAQDEAHQAGLELTDKQADTVLWEYTGFPSFWQGESAEAHFRKQIREWVASLEQSPQWWGAP